MLTSEVDALLSAQIIVAWAGEGHVGDERRLGWWRSDLVSEFGGLDLFQRLLPTTAPWAVLQAVREAARRVDARELGLHQIPLRAHHQDLHVRLAHPHHGSPSR